jgi:hypothetical protein
MIKEEEIIEIKDHTDIINLKENKDHWFILIRKLVTLSILQINKKDFKL